MNAPVLPAYAELHCLSNFTFLRGASHPEELVARAAQLGYRALALTDECSLAGVVRAHGEALRQGLHLLIGSELRLVDANGAPAAHLVVLAQNREGYGNLSELITLARTRGRKQEGYRLTPQDLAEPQPPYEHLRGLPDCLVLLVPPHGVAREHLREQLAWAARLFAGRLWLALELLHRPDDDLHLACLTSVARETGVPLVAAGHVLMHVRSRKPLQDTLSAIRLGRPVHACGTELMPNAEQHLRARLRLAALYPPEALQATVEIAGRCTFNLEELRYEYPDELVPAGLTPADYLRQETLAGARRRYPQGVPETVSKQLADELALIAELAYEPYFLTVYDIVKFARERKILCQGRGSAANSAVCYCLGITAVDPAQSQLLFGRFLSRERNEPPDIDVDFEHQRREEVIQYIYGKYGRQRAALAAAVTTYRTRSALRETGKALGIDASIVDQVCAGQQWWDGRRDLLQRLARQGLSPEAPAVRHWCELVEQLVGFPRHLSQHTGGFVISRGKLSRLVPIENAAMPERCIIQWDKDDLEALKLLKVDVLALGMLSALRRALDMLGQRQGRWLDLADIPREDPATYEMLCQADTVGVFQVESRAQMSMLPRLQPRKFYDLVVQVAIVRPGPIQGGMVHPYLKRRQEPPEKIHYAKDALAPALARTLGVPIFQEQVMQIAMIAADFTAGEADDLRRSMAAWRRKGGLEKFQEKIVSGMLKNGYERTFADAICRQIEGFGEYGFPESHAASFAQLVYASAWIKRHAPAIFLCALLNSQPMGFYSASQLVQDARRHQVEVRAVDVTASAQDCTLEARGDGLPPAVRLGLAQVAGLAADAARRIAQARAQAPYRDIDELAARAQLSRQELAALAAADALATLLGGRRQAQWAVAAHLPATPLLGQSTLQDDGAPVPLPRLREGEEILADYASTGLTLRRHPLALLRPRLSAMRLKSAQELRDLPNGRRARACGIVTMRQRPGTAKGTVFVSLEDETGVVNVIVWPDLVERQRKELLGTRLMAVHGVWQCTGEGEHMVRHLVARRLIDLSPLLGRLATPSRNFH
ncbi:MAG: error-prone DNA polymerase [Burkholderiales bacterium]|nr:error-prone DNA polymerase [Burkholderiales bacterium]